MTVTQLMTFQWLQFGAEVHLSRR